MKAATKAEHWVCSKVVMTVAWRVDRWVAQLGMPWAVLKAALWAGAKTVTLENLMVARMALQWVLQKVVWRADEKVAN